MGKYCSKPARGSPPVGKAGRLVARTAEPSREPLAGKQGVAGEQGDFPEVDDGCCIGGKGDQVIVGGVLVDRISPSHHQFLVELRIVSKPDARLKSLVKIRHRRICSGGKRQRLTPEGGSRVRLPGYRLTVQQIDRLAKELPAHTEMRGEGWRDLPVVLNIARGVDLSKRSDGRPIGEQPKGIPAGALLQVVVNV